ncbi:hypothetical protein ACLKA7_000850 [Drosophila subpalustris]
MDFASTTVAKQVRECSFKFDGSSKPLEFLEQVEWSAETYGLDLIPELLKGTALKWYIANNEHWITWASFQEFFLPRDYFSKLLEEVSRRKQGIDEPFKRYKVEMQTLMRPLRYSKERNGSRFTPVVSRTSERLPGRIKTAASSSYCSWLRNSRNSSGTEKGSVNIVGKTGSG